MNIQRYEEKPGGMTADEQGRWVRYEEHKARMDALEAECRALAALLAERLGRSAIYWREMARRSAQCD